MEAAVVVWYGAHFSLEATLVRGSAVSLEMAVAHTVEALSYQSAFGCVVITSLTPPATFFMSSRVLMISIMN
jgi:hypothetical protein